MSRCSLTYDPYQKTQAVAANFAWWIPARFLTDLLISVIKINVFCNKAAEETPHLWLMNDFQGGWCQEKREMKFLLFCTYCHHCESAFASCGNVQQRTPQQRMFTANSGHSWALKNGVLNKGPRIGNTEFSTELSSITCLAKFHFPANFSQFYDTPV